MTIRNIAIFIGVILLCIGIFTVYNQHKEIMELQFKQAESGQNLQAYKDSLFTAKDSINTSAIFIRSLNNDLNVLQGKYSILQSQYQVAVNSIKDSGAGTSTVVDSIGEVSFKGVNGIANYEGHTSINLNSKQSTWNLSIKFTPVQITSDVYKDSIYWKIRTVSLTEGVILKGESVIDEATLEKIKDIKPIEKIRSEFAVGGALAKDRLYGGVMYKPSNWIFGAQYLLFGTSTSGTEWYNQLQFTAFYFLF